MNTPQNYGAKATKEQTSEPAANLSTPTPVNSGDLSGDYLNDYLKDPVDRHNARLMVRAWFLAHSLQEEEEATLNPCNNRVNAYLFELLDSFLSAPVVAEKEVDHV